MREAAEKRRKLWILLLAVICSSFVVANSSVMPVQAAEDTDANTGEVVTSGTFGEYNGEIYTVDKVAKKGYHCISGQYKDTMAIYQDKIYWRKSSTVSGQSSEIIRMDLDGDNQTVLTNSAKPNAKFCIYNNRIFSFNSFCILIPDQHFFMFTYKIISRSFCMWHKSDIRNKTENLHKA